MSNAIQFNPKNWFVKLEVPTTMPHTLNHGLLIHSHWNFEGGKGFRKSPLSTSLLKKKTIEFFFGQVYVQARPNFDHNIIQIHI